MIISNIKKLRMIKGIYKLKDFAEAVGVSRNTAFLWERNKGKPTVDNTSKICQVLGCQYGDLFTETEVEEKV